MKRMRSFLSVALVLCMILSAALCCATGVSAKTPVSNVILMIGDGMGAAQAQAGAIYKGSQLVFQGFENQTMVTTSSLSGVTDSAAAATAMATGIKTNNSNLGLDKSGNKVENLVEFSKARGLKTGVIATQVLPHATPAGFTSHVTSRYSYNTIAVQQLLLQPDVLMGGGATYFTSRQALIDENNFVMAQTLEQARAVAADKNLLGVFDSNYITADESPELAEMTALGLERLSGDNGFFVMIEGSDIDSGCHENNMEKMVSELLDFDDAVAVAKKYADDNPGTLLIVTADHETGGLTIPEGTVKEKLSDRMFTSVSHTGQNVPLYAYGTGAEQLCEEDTIDNTDIYKYIAENIEDSYGTAPVTDFTNYNSYRVFFELPEGWAPPTAEVKGTGYELSARQMEEVEESIYSVTFFGYDPDTASDITLTFSDPDHTVGPVDFEGFYKLYRTSTAQFEDYSPVQGAIYFEKPASWQGDIFAFTSGTCYYGAYPGTAMKPVEGTDNLYSLVISDDTMVEDFLEFTVRFSDSSGARSTTETAFAGFSKVFSVFGGADTTAAYGCWYDYPKQVQIPSETKKTVYLADETEWNIKSDNASLFVQCDAGTPVELNYLGSDDNGARVWSADIPDNAQGILFLRKNNRNLSEIFNVFVPVGNPADGPLYALTDDNGGYWAPARDTQPDPELPILDTDVTVYYAVPQSLLDAGYDIKVNNRCDNNAGVQVWTQTLMSDTSNTYYGKKIYSATYKLKYGGVYMMQLQNYLGTTWKSQLLLINDEWTWENAFNGKLYTGSEWVDYEKGTDVGENIQKKVYLDASALSWYTCATINAYDGDGNLIAQNEPMATAKVPTGYTLKGATTATFYIGYIPENAATVEFFRNDNGNIYNFCCDAATPDTTVITPDGDVFVLDGQKSELGYRTGAWQTLSVPTGLLGDADLSDEVNIRDATLIQKYVAKLSELDAQGLKNANVNGDTDVNIKDATAIQKYCAKIETGFAIGQAA